MNEAVSIPPAGPFLFTLYLHYFATGEGVRQEIMVCRELSEAHARKTFLDQFYPGDPEAQWYVGIGLDVYPGVYRPVLAPWLTEGLIRSLEERATYSDPFYLHRWFNLS